MNFFQIFSFAICIFFIGCGDSQSTSDSPESAALTSFPSGTILSINPVLEFETELTEGVSATASYSNDDPTHFWKGNERVTVTLTNNGNSVILSFKLTNGDDVELILSNFIDIGNDGYIDEYSVIGKVNGDMKIDQIGRFSGSVKPRLSNSSSDINVNRAPTKEEFDMFVTLAGSLFLFQSESSPDPEGAGVVELKSDGTAISYAVDGNRTPEWESSTYSYDYNDGSPLLYSSSSGYLDPSDSNRLVHVKQTTKLKFDNFFEGTYEVSSLTHSIDGEDSDQNVNAKGTWFLTKSPPW